MIISLQEEFWTDPGRSISKAYERTDQAILSHSPDLGRGGSTAVTAILMNNGRNLWVANVGDSRAVLSKRGQAIQLSVDHEPNTERNSIENKGGFVSNMPGSICSLFLFCSIGGYMILFLLRVQLALCVLPSFFFLAYVGVLAMSSSI